MIRFGNLVNVLRILSSSAAAIRQLPDSSRYLDTKRSSIARGELCSHAILILTGTKALKGLFEEDAKLCFGCHTKADFEGNDIHQPIASGGCLSCHEAHSADNEKLLKAAKPDLCFGCHGESEFKRTVVHPPLAKGGCMNCHSPHKSDFPALLSEKNEKFCSRCHDIDRYASGRYVHSPAKPGSRMGSCVKCHNPHTSQNAKLLERPVPELCMMSQQRNHAQSA
jgi:predicted CXXCH cytochrome family protein